MKRLALVALLLVAAPAAGQSVKLPAEVRADPGTFAVVKAETDCEVLEWVPLDAGLSLIPPDLLKDSRSAVVMSGRAGRYRLLAYGAKGNKPSPPAVVVVVVGEAPPVPPGPTPPGPTPPGPAPPPSGDLRVLVAFETGELSTYPSSQVAAMKAGQLENYLRAKAGKEPDGSPSFRRWDYQQNLDGAPDWWPKMMARAKEKAPGLKVPVIVFLKGETVQAEFLPATIAEVMALVKKWGGE